MPDIETKSARIHGKRYWVQQLTNAELARYVPHCRKPRDVYGQRYAAHYAWVIGTAKAEIARRAAAEGR